MIDRSRTLRIAALVTVLWLGLIGFALQQWNKAQLGEPTCRTYEPLPQKYAKHLDVKWRKDQLMKARNNGATKRSDSIQHERVGANGAD